MINATPVARNCPVMASAGQPDRRAFLAQAASASVLALAAASALAQTADPIFAAIQAHRAAAATSRSEIDVHCEVVRCPVIAADRL